MPFKTRRQKESAFGRRVNFIEGGLVKYGGRDLKPKAVESKKTTSEVLKSSFDSGESYDYVKKELSKIIILAVIIIGFQLALKVLNISIF